MARYASRGDRGGQVEEFKAMVKALPREGIEVILDVVYNHSCEGNHLGPTLSFRGIDNPVYYRLTPEKKRYYVDRTGIGNTLNTGHPQVLKLLMDSLRYWVLEMHVDGFRFDLAAALATELQEANRLAGFFDVIHQDPVISQVKLIAEPWSLGEGGYQIGNFPILWAEWNGKFRDTARSYWRGDGHQLAELGYRLTGSSDLYHHDGRRPFASINFVTAHDGFTLHDLVSYDHKHNAANGEDNQDGSDDNRSANYGVEGPTEDSSILALRERQQRNLLASLLLASGVPMLCGGDEPDRTQQGNNNAYCQDNELSWYDWELDERRQTLLEFTRHLIRLRQQHPNLHRRRFFQGRRIRGSDIKDLTWLRPDGTEMTDQGWEAVAVHCLGLRLAGESVDEVDENGRPVTNDTLLILLNPTPQAVGFTLPPCPSEGRWWVALNTDTPTLMPDQQSLEGSERLELAARSLVLLRQPGR
jgi:glycogen operon protein